MVGGNTLLVGLHFLDGVKVSVVLNRTAYLSHAFIHIGWVKVEGKAVVNLSCKSVVGGSRRKLLSTSSNRLPRLQRVIPLDNLIGNNASLLEEDAEGMRLQRYAHERINILAISIARFLRTGTGSSTVTSTSPVLIFVWLPCAPAFSSTTLADAKQ